jgi:hypothetical protein
LSNNDETIDREPKNNNDVTASNNDVFDIDG